MRAKRFVVTAALGLVLAAVPVWAHHAFNSEFDANKPVTLKGVVTKMEWINPHAWMHIDVRKSDGSVEKWMVETGTPNTLLRRGLTKVRSRRERKSSWTDISRRTEQLRVNGRDVTLPNGQTLFLGQRGHRRSRRTPPERVAAAKALRRTLCRAGELQWLPRQDQLMRRRCWMSRRFFTSTGILAVVIAGVSLLSTPLLGQTPAAGAKPAQATNVPKTPGAIQTCRECGTTPQHAVAAACGVRREGDADGRRGGRVSRSRSPRT